MYKHGALYGRTVYVTCTCICSQTLAFSYMTGTIASFYSASSVLIAAGITALVCLSITLFAMQTKVRTRRRGRRLRLGGLVSVVRSRLTGCCFSLSENRLLTKLFTVVVGRITLHRLYDCAVVYLFARLFTCTCVLVAFRLTSRCALAYSSVSAWSSSSSASAPSSSTASGATTT